MASAPAGTGAAWRPIPATDVGPPVERGALPPARPRGQRLPGAAPEGGAVESERLGDQAREAARDDAGQPERVARDGRL